jgi:hypothetical protein
MADRRNLLNERKPAAPAGARVIAAGEPRSPATIPPPPAMPSSPSSPSSGRPERAVTAMEAHPRRPPSKFGAAADGWDAYNSWLDRVRQPTPPSRQAVIAKALYSVSSYKNWADKARDAFAGPAAPATGAGGGARGPFKPARE